MDKYSKRIFWIIFGVALVVVGAFASAHATRFLPPAPDFGTKTIQVFGSLVLVALCIERAAEVILTPIRGVEGRQLDHKMEEAAKQQEALENEAKSLAQKIITETDPAKVIRLTADASALQVRLESAKQAHLTAIKEHDEQSARTFVWAMLIALVIGLLAAGAGVRVLSPVFSIDPVAGKETVVLPSTSALSNGASIVSTAAVQIASSSSQLSNAVTLLLQAASPGTNPANLTVLVLNSASNALAQARAAGAGAESASVALRAPSGPIVLGPLQHQWFSWLDIFLTAVILAGGSDGVHKIFSLYNGFMASNTPRPKP